MLFLVAIRFFFLGNCDGLHSHVIVSRKTAVAHEAGRRNLHKTGLQVIVDIGLGDGSVERRKLLVVNLIVAVLDGNLNGNAQVDVGVHGSDGKGEVNDVSAGADAGVESRKEKLVAGGGQVEGDIEGGIAADVVLASLLGSLGIVGLGRLSLVPESAVVAGIPSRGGGLVLPSQLGIRAHGDRSGGRVGERRAASVLDARTQVGEVVHGSAAEECGGVKLCADGVDLGRSNVLGGGAELEVDLQVGAAGVEEVSRKHDSTGLRSSGLQLALLSCE